MTRSVDPMITTIAREFMVPAATAALLSSAFTLPYALGQPVLGPLGDILGKTTILKVCIWFLAIVLAISAFAPNFSFLLALRPLAGIFAGGLMPVAMAILGDRYPPNERSLAIARFLSTALIGQVAGASGAGLLLDWVGWRGVMIITAVVAAAAATGAMIIFPRGSSPPRNPFRFADVVTGYRNVFSNPNAKVCFGIVLVEGITVFGVTPFFGDMLEQAHTGGPREAGFIIAGIGIGGLAFSLSISLIMRFFARKTMIIASGVIAAAGLLAIAMDLNWTRDIVYFSFTGFGFFMLHNSMQTEVSELAPQSRGTAFSMNAFFFFTGQAIGPVIFGPMHLVIGASLTLVIMALLLAVSALLGGLFMRRRLISGLQGF